MCHAVCGAASLLPPQPLQQYVRERRAPDTRALPQTCRRHNGVCVGATPARCRGRRVVQGGAGAGGGRRLRSAETRAPVAAALRGAACCCRLPCHAPCHAMRHAMSHVTHFNSVHRLLSAGSASVSGRLLARFGRILQSYGVRVALLGARCAVPARRHCCSCRQRGLPSAHRVAPPHRGQSNRCGSWWLPPSR